MNTASTPFKTVRLPAPIYLDGGRKLANVEIAYENWGQMNADKSNVILVCHALTGDQFAASENPLTGRPAWWPHIIGSDKPIDTDKYYVIATNVLGGCMGSTGPADRDEAGEIYGLNFPVITIADMVRAQIQALEQLGIHDLFCVIGGSMGAMQAIQWAIDAPDRVFCAIPIAGAVRQSAQIIGFYEVGRQAIMADPDWRDGDYIKHNVKPEKGLSVARMAALITYVSEQRLKQKFDRAMQDRTGLSFGFDADFEIESYLRYQGRSFVDRYDANSYLYVTRAMDYFDPASAHGGQLAKAFSGTKTRFCVFSFSSDWHYPPEHSKHIVQALNAAGAEASYVEIETDKGHDAFLLPDKNFESGLAGFITSMARLRQLEDNNVDKTP